MRIPALLAASLLAVVTGVPHASALTISGDYYEDTVSGGCPGSTCEVAFSLPAATTGQFLYLEELSCIVQITGAVANALYYLTDGGNTNIRRPHYIDAPPGLNGTSFSKQTRFKITGGPPRTLVIRAITREGQSGLPSMSCSIIGTLKSQ